ncbi:Acyl-CoA desaturase [Penicillium canariense]|uniref:Acyl-CoA desaturase n=1 Tax=Penicillium canariense TaxID=189055 RepID=A0A9W9LHK0_9EURO|nr:Acyl-CoA desaturase [Penicillium canariense]KAJ5157406.1 Acyl-CoA desaturase [Penicillium canariense]
MSNRTSLASLNWLHTIALVMLPLGALMILPWIHAHRATIWFMLGYGYLRGFAITAGYHRLWAHRAYTARTPLKLALAILGAGAAQDSIKKWCRDHRAHHRYVDTDKDPYNIQKGFFYAHMGWILFEEGHGVQTTGRVDISDLKSDPIVQWQSRNHLFLALLVGYVAPTVICGLCFEDFLGGFVFAGCLGTALQQQVAFCVNSVAHWAGTQPYGAGKTPRDHVLTGILTLGEGYHNFHHEFPIDYRNGVRWHDFDPTKWVIWICYQIGLVTNLRRFPQNEIEKGRLQQRRAKLDKEYETVDWGVPLAELPVMKWEEYKQQARTGCNLIVIGAAVHDVSAFVTEHPGGPAMITGAIGKDATEMFGGGMYRHSNAASNLLHRMRIARIEKKVNLASGED